MICNYIGQRNGPNGFYTGNRFDMPISRVHDQYNGIDLTRWHAGFPSYLLLSRVVDLHLDGLLLQLDLCLRLDRHRQVTLTLVVALMYRLPLIVVVVVLGVGDV